MAQVVHKFGRNDTVGSTWEDVWMRGGIYAWPTAASKHRISSASTKDTSTGSGGAGARTVHIEGLDTNFNPISETVSLTNATAETTLLYRRVHRAYVATAGAYAGLTAGGNKGAITINDASSAASATIVVDSTVGMGQTQVARYTSPAGLFMYVNSFSLSVNTAANKEADIALFARYDADTVAAPFTARRLQLQLDGLSGPMNMNPDVPWGPYPPKTDLWWAAKATAATQLTVDYEIILTPTTFQRSI